MRYMNAPARAAFGYEEGGVRGQKSATRFSRAFPSPASSARTTCPVSRDSRPGKTRMSAFTGGSSSGTKSFSGTTGLPGWRSIRPRRPRRRPGERRTRAAGDGGPSAVGREPGGRHPGHPGAAGGAFMGRTGATWSRPDWGRGPFRRPSSGSLLPSRPGERRRPDPGGGRVAGASQGPPPGGLPRRGAAAAGLSRSTGTCGPGGTVLLRRGPAGGGGAPGLPGHRQPRERLECTTMLLSLSHFLMGERSKREGRPRTLSSAATTP